MEQKRVKTCEGKEEAGNSNSTVAADRISNLPDPIIHHILSLVPTVYAIRLSILSKRWRRMWYSIPTLQFSESEGFRTRESFDMFVEQCLIHRTVAMRYIADSVVTSFKLDVTYSPYIDRPAVNRWSKSPIIENTVQELRIFAHPKHTGGLGDNNYMPSVALNGRSLHTIKLTGVKLDDYCSMDLPSLKSLCLDLVTFDYDVNDTLHDIMIACPSLEKFSFLDYWTNFGKMKISSSSLKFLDIETGCKRVHIDASNLQSLVVDSSGRVQINFSSCTAIRDLCLPGYFKDNNQNLEDQISKLTQLENLTLNIHRKFKDIRISSPTLKFFYLTKLEKEILNVTTETPNLVSFKYEGTMDLSINMKTPNPKLRGSFSICDSDNCLIDYWYAKLMTFLSNINCLWNSLSLCFDEEKDLVVPKKMRRTRRPLWPNLKHLKVTVASDLTRKSELRKVFEWLSPSLETLSIEKK